MVRAVGWGGFLGGHGNMEIFLSAVAEILLVVCVFLGGCQACNLRGAHVLGTKCGDPPNRIKESLCLVKVKNL